MDDAPNLMPTRILGGVPDGYEPFVIAEKARAHGLVVFVTRDDVHLQQMLDALKAISPDITLLPFPAWDCVPYDRVSPHRELQSHRVATLGRLEEGLSGPAIVITTAAAVLQKVPPKGSFSNLSRNFSRGARLDVNELRQFLVKIGYMASEQVMEPGEFAIRGGLVDLFPAGAEMPVRLDLFGDEIDELRPFDPMSQRTSGTLNSVTVGPVSEVLLHSSAVERFRSNYRSLFGAAESDDALYESISNGQSHPGMEHWLPLFYGELAPLFEYTGSAPIFLEDAVADAVKGRVEQIADYYEARRAMDPKSGGQRTLSLEEAGGPYHPVPADQLFLSDQAWVAALNQKEATTFSAFAPADLDGVSDDAGGRPGRNFADVRAQGDVNIYDAVIAYIRASQGQGRKVVLAVTSEGARTRMAKVLREHGLSHVIEPDGWAALDFTDHSSTALLVLSLETGFETPNWAVLTEQDILGDRMAGRTRKQKRASDQFIQDAGALVNGDLVVHEEHGIGRFQGLEAIDAGGAPHDCVKLIYAGDDKLYVPVENIEVLSRFGSDTAGVMLDKLGGVAWQARKSKLKQRIRDMAEQLIRVAAARHIKTAPEFQPQTGLYDEFAARFPFAETEDQLTAISDCLEDLTRGRPMDRLLCGDVGFGKTEVALRTAFSVALSGAQVAVVVPTTLLARQHYRTFKERFAGLPVKVAQLSRLVSPKETKAVKEGLASGEVDIVIGTHALLGKSMEFRDLGLLVVDEEQHFGVAHKERLKQLKENVHVLTMTATPIPRTLQLALAGVRELSLITTPPVDRLAVRTFVTPYDGVVVREALMREKYRGGQSYYVCPRVRDLDTVAGRLEALVPELKVGIAHGQMPPAALEDVMTAFADGQYDILLATNIIESGLDLPQVNTIIIHRADMFGLSQLYQLRGRVGRSKVRGYSYLTLNPSQKLTDTASKRLNVMQTLDTLGAGFSLASHDLDIRGAGNLLGDEQSGHIKEVGIELYQHLLEEAIEAARGGDGDALAVKESWSPAINSGTAVLIPDDYVKDLGLRMSLYRRIADLSGSEDIDAFAVELADRFGPLPDELENLLKVVELKDLCRRANVERLDAGPKGIVITFKDNTFANPPGLVDFIGRQAGTAKLKPDHKLVLVRTWRGPKDRLPGLKTVMDQLAQIAQAA